MHLIFFLANSGLVLKRLIFQRIFQNKNYIYDVSLTHRLPYRSLPFGNRHKQHSRLHLHCWSVFLSIKKIMIMIMQYVNFARLGIKPCRYLS